MFGKKDNHKLSDLELVHRFRFSHDSKYVGELYLRYTHLIYGVCLKYLGNEDESKDAVMEIVEKLIVDLKKHEIKNFKSWLYTVSKNHCLVKLRKEHIHELKVDEFKKITIENVELEKFLNLDSQKEHDLQLLQEAIAKLTSKQKQCIEMFYLEGKSYEEIVKQSGFDTMAVKSYIQNGKRNLKNYISERIQNNN